MARKSNKVQVKRLLARHAKEAGSEVSPGEQGETCETSWLKKRISRLLNDDLFRREWKENEGAYEAEREKITKYFIRGQVGKK